MRCLLFVSLILLTSCAPAVYKNLQSIEGNAHCVERFIPKIERALYQTQVTVLKNHLSGILLVKHMPDSSMRIVFSNEAGYTFFDFAFTASGDFKVYAIIEKMDKEAVKQTLRKDFELVFMNMSKTVTTKVFKKDSEIYNTFINGEDRYYYITDAGCEKLLRMERGNDRKKVLEAFASPLQNGVPDSIFIKHANFTFTISLKRIYDNAD